MISYKLRREEKNCGFGRILPAYTPYTLHYTLNKTKNIMKKSYIAPQTEAIELLGANAIMMASPGGGFIDGSPADGMWGN